MAKILIAEDEASIRKLIRKLLESEGHEILEASDGIQCMDLYKKKNPDLVITDLIMPDKEGLEVIREIRNLNPQAKIIAISGGGLVDPKMYLNLAQKLGAVRTFTKPIENEVLISAITETLT